MAWYVFLFPVFSGMALLTLMPAAANGGKGESPNGTPWNWPLYPWCGLAFLAVALIIRSFGLSTSFEFADGFTNAFRGYYLIPLLLAIITLLTELAMAARAFRRASWLACFAASVLILAFPGEASNALQEDFLALLRPRLGAPIQWTCLLLLLYYAYCQFRRVRGAELGITATVLLLACARSDTLSLTTLQPPTVFIGVLVGAGLMTYAYRSNSSWRFLLGAAIVAVAVVAQFQSVFHSPTLGLLLLCSFVWMLVGLVFNDRLARFIRRWIRVCSWTIGVCILGGALALGVRQSAMEVSFAFVAMSLIMFGYWWKQRTVERLVGLLSAISFLAIHSVLLFHAYFQGQVMHIAGRNWLYVGLLCFLVGVTLSLLKAGAARTSLEFATTMNRRLSSWFP